MHAKPYTYNTQGCHSRLAWLKPFFLRVHVGLAVALLIADLVWVGLFRFEYVLAHRLIFTLLGAHGFRTLTFLSTRLPTIALDCRVNEADMSKLGGCGDYIFSGHAVVMLSLLCLVWSQRAARRPRWPLLLLLPLSVALALAVFGYALERWHYTVDIVLPLYVTPTMWACSRQVFGDEPPRADGERLERLIDFDRMLGRGGKVFLSTQVLATMIGGGVAVGAANASLVGSAMGVPTDAVAGMLVGMAVTVSVLCLLGEDRVVGALGGTRAQSS
jgi:hypothetical protein